jgi:hypothetical protein
MPFISSVRGSYGPQGRFGLRVSTLGRSSANPALSAAAILADDPSALDGTYWLQPTGCPSPFQVHCYMTIEGGGWQLAYRFATDISTSGGFGSGTWGVANWAGWGYNTKSQIDALGTPGTTNPATAADTQALSPTFAYSSFKDVMVIANRAGQQSKRVGWRHNTSIANMYSVTGGTSAETAGNSILFGQASRWLQSLDIQSDTNLGNTVTDRYGFKIRSDAGSTSSASNHTGGFWTSTKHYGSMIGCGWESTGVPSGSATFGGGFGGRYGDGNWYQAHGHWWNHGDQRFSGSNQTQCFYGHAVYIRA